MRDRTVRRGIGFRLLLLTGLRGPASAADPVVQEPPSLAARVVREVFRRRVFSGEAVMSVSGSDLFGLPTPDMSLSWLAPVTGMAGAEDSNPCSSM